VSQEAWAYGGYCICLKEVCTHSCAVSDIVPDIVSDYRRVPWVVLRYACLNFSDKICADVSCFCIYAATDTREKAYERCAETDPTIAIGLLEHDIECCHSDQREPATAIPVTAPPLNAILRARQAVFCRVSHPDI